MKPAKPSKTNAARLLDSLGIAYEVQTYEVDPDDLSAIAVARKIGMPAEQVFKTLLTRAATGARGAFLCGYSRRCRTGPEEAGAGR